MFIYITTNLVNNKKYIGMCSRSDNNYIGSGKLLKNSIKKYGKENFKREIIAYAESYEELCELEKYYINMYDAANDPNFYNLNEGGLGGNSQLLKKYWGSLNKEERKNAREWNGHFINNKFNDYNKEWKNKVSKSVKANWDSMTEEERKIRCRPMHENRDISSSNNPRAKKASVNGKMYECLKDALKDYPHIPYPTLKAAARRKNGFISKYKVEVKYVC